MDYGHKTNKLEESPITRAFVRAIYHNYRKILLNAICLRCRVPAYYKASGKNTARACLTMRKIILKRSKIYTAL